MANVNIARELMKRSVEEVEKVFAWLTDSQKDSVVPMLFDEYHRQCAEAASVAHA